MNREQLWRHHYVPRRVRICLVFLLLLVPELGAISSGSAAGVTGGITPALEYRSTGQACDRCDPGASSPFYSLSEATIDSIARALSMYNVGVIARTDSLYRCGFFGTPDTDEAKARARVHFQLRSRSAFHYTADLCADQNRVSRADDESSLRPFATNYLSAAVYPLRFVANALIGAGGFCLEYQMPGSYDEKSIEGGIEIRVRRDDVDLGKRPRVAVLSRQLSTSSAKLIELLYESQFCGHVSLERLVDEGDTLEVLSLYDLKGVHVRKWGTNRLAAIVEYRSAVTGDRDPAHPRVGGRVYFPGIKLKMPLILPDLGLDDLREFDFPPPVLALDWQNQLPGPFPAWLVARQGGTFAQWKSHGAPPAVLAERFPEM